MSFAAGVPGFHDASDFVEPRHGDRSAGLKDDDGLGIGRGHLFDKHVLIFRQREIRQVHPFAGPLIHEDDSDLRFLSQGDGGFPVGSGIELDVGAGSGRGHSFRRRCRKPNVFQPSRSGTAGWVHLGGAASGNHAGVGVRANDGNGMNLRRIKRQDTGAILEQNAALLCNFTGGFQTSFGIDNALFYWIVNDAGGELRP